MLHKRKCGLQNIADDTHPHAMFHMKDPPYYQTYDRNFCYIRRYMFQIQYKRTCRVGQIIRWCMTQHIAINTTSGLFPASPLKSSETEIILRASISSLVILFSKNVARVIVPVYMKSFICFFLWLLLLLFFLLLLKWGKLFCV